MPVGTRGVHGIGFWKDASILKRYFVWPKNGSKYYLKYMFLAFPILGILGLGTPLVGTRDVPRTGFWNGASTLKQYFVLPKNGSKYYRKYTFLAFPVLGILGLGTALVGTGIHIGNALAFLHSCYSRTLVSDGRSW